MVVNGTIIYIVQVVNKDRHTQTYGLIKKYTSNNVLARVYSFSYANNRRINFISIQYEQILA
ncbi:MAG: hypothetical protein ACTSWR_08745 [Candidatus Helarchaeota archaeon]